MLISYSPLRISFGGGGTDIEPFVSKYGGSVINTTIDRGVLVKYRSDNFPLELSSRDFVKSYVVNMNHGKETVTEKMASLIMSRGISTGRVIMSGDVPPGSGLGSSSAAISSLLNLINRITGKASNSDELAEEAYQIEKNYFKIVLGKQDPYATSYGGFKYMEFRGNEVKYESLNGYTDFIRELENRTILVYTGRTRQSSEVLLDQVNRAEKGDTEITEKLQKMRDIACSMKKSVVGNDFNGFADGINEGWEIKKTLGSEITNPRVERIMKLAMKNGGMAARLMGGGSQGFVLIVSRENMMSELQRRMMDYSAFVIRISFDLKGTRFIDMK